MKRYLGIDGGGSGSRWALLDADGELLGRGEGPPIHVTTMGVEECAHAVGRLIMGAGADVPVVAVVGEAAWGTEASVLGRDRVRVVSDIEAVAAAALGEGAGVALWSGTGSFAVARDEGGRLRRTGGRGPLLGDEGSGHAIVVAAAQAAVRARDRIGPATNLLARLEDALDVAGVEALARVLQRMSPGEIAGLFPVVVAVAADGDEVARSILDGGLEQLAGLAEAACGRVGLAKAQTRVVLGGGALREKAYADRMVEVLLGRGFQEVVRKAAREPCEGAALLARAWELGEEPLCSWVEGERDSGE